MNYNFYKPLAERTPDTQYKEATRRVRDEGQYMKNPFMANGRYAHFWLNPLVYKYENGIPLITERNICIQADLAKNERSDRLP